MWRLNLLVVLKETTACAYSDSRNGIDTCKLLAATAVAPYCRKHCKFTLFSVH